jgi:Uma2 family endonuclease
MSTMPSTEIEAAVAGDQRVLLYGVIWDDYLRLLAMRGPDVRIPRIAYLDGEVELMSPGERHETVGTMIGRLLEIYAYVRDVPLYGMGSTTFRKRAKARGAEPDESYVLGRKPKPRPDLAIEVVVTSGGIDKLAIYAGLGVPEVWLWRRGSLQVHVLRGNRHRPAAASALLPDLDVELLASFVGHSDQHQAVVDYARRLRGED